MIPKQARPYIGATVIFHYRKDPSVRLEGCIVSVLENTIVVEILHKETIQTSNMESRQVVRHGKYVMKEMESKNEEKEKCTYQNSLDL